MLAATAPTRSLISPAVMSSTGHRDVLLGRVVEAVPRIGQVRERIPVAEAEGGQGGHRRRFRGRTSDVIEGPGGGVGLVGLHDRSEQRPGDCLELDAHDVVEDAPPVRESGYVATDDTEDARLVR